MFAQLHERLTDWLFQARGPEAGDVVLHRRRVFILPTRSGLAFAVTLLLLLIGSINYGLSLGFLLTFFVGATGVVGMNYTWRNLAHLSLRPLSVEPVFAGEAAEFAFALDNPRRYGRYAVSVCTAPPLRLWRKTPAKGQPQSSATVAMDVAARSMQRGVYGFRVERRGWQPLPRLLLETTYPLGLWRAWSYWQPAMRCLVYPAPEADPPPLPAGSWQTGEEEGVAGMGQENFAGVREYQVGDSPRHIAWKVVARLDERLATKAFDGGGRRELWLRWHDTPVRLGSEARLSRLAAWVLQADARGLEYGLELPSRRLEASRGPGHRQACLEALALEPQHG